MIVANKCNTSEFIEEMIRIGLMEHKKQRDDEQLRIHDENRRLKEWEKKFDQEQKLREEELISKFYTDHSRDNNKVEPTNSSDVDIETNDNEINKK